MPLLTNETKPTVVRPLYCGLALLLALSISCFPASAANVYQYTQKNGVVAFSDRAPINQPYKLLKFDCYACRPDSSLDWQKTRLIADKFTDSIEVAANTHQLDPALIRAVIHAESGFQPRAVSKQGARGLMQLMPATARELGVKNSFDSHSNILAGSAYLAKLLQNFNGDIRLASAAYNAGPSAVAKYAGIPPYAETKAYVKRVEILFKRYQQLARQQARAG
ncbi:lytic transglycosylase domain-containing protein [Rheinheimera sp. 4Y26]|uniref:lytic transglycosylase domain-containing protein n=1 Tax=Rheinheimera sp. 4Y26 TaxID=2977811 RepID=UPI0021B10DDD|nr:lytic transglycosylase domain-containing protein [Rheinheimera sp. 4Y26]MCT6700012.1 lytic transglycosylase domain-containing protein [Rheinheimera sp. 4Y26]